MENLNDKTQQVRKLQQSCVEEDNDDLVCNVPFNSI